MTLLRKSDEGTLVTLFPTKGVVSQLEVWRAAAHQPREAAVPAAAGPVFAQVLFLASQCGTLCPCTEMPGTAKWLILHLETGNLLEYLDYSWFVHTRKSVNRMSTAALQVTAHNDNRATITQQLLLVRLSAVFSALASLCPEWFQVPGIQLWTKQTKNPVPWSFHSGGTILVCLFVYLISFLQPCAFQRTKLSLQG